MTFRYFTRSDREFSGFYHKYVIFTPISKYRSLLRTLDCIMGAFFAENRGFHDIGRFFICFQPESRLLQLFDAFYNFLRDLLQLNSHSLQLMPPIPCTYAKNLLQKCYHSFYLDCPLCRIKGVF